MVLASEKVLAWGIELLGSVSDWAKNSPQKHGGNEKQKECYRLHLGE